MYVVLLGPPGAGKGTQAAGVAADLGVVHLASGDLFRQVRQEDSALGREVRSYYDRGLLVPDELTIRLFLERLGAPDGARGAILDGFPRTLEQARALDRALAARGKRVCAAVYLTAPIEVLVRRISGRLLCRAAGHTYHVEFNPPRVPGRCDQDGSELYQRPDDTPEVARQRVEEYLAKTVPVVAHYREQGVLREVNADQPIERVRPDLAAAIRQSCRQV